jgi:hypothetical protein
MLPWAILVYAEHIKVMKQLSDAQDSLTWMHILSSVLCIQVPCLLLLFTLWTWIHGLGVLYFDRGNET